jgi:hypothetical protein
MFADFRIDGFPSNGIRDHTVKDHSFAYTAKPNLKQSFTAENWLVAPEKNTDSADGIGPAVSRDA